MTAKGSTIRVTGGSHEAREAFRERLRWLLVRDPDAPAYDEAHAAEALEYRLEGGAGIPFPSLVEASRSFGMLRVEVEYPAAGRARAGRARAGRVVLQSGMIAEKVDLSEEQKA